MKIAIDPGHGGPDPGAMYKDMQEKDVVLSYGRIVSSLLEGRHIRMMTRDEDKYILPSYRASMANNWYADVFVSLHCNSCVLPETASGIEVLYYPTSLLGRSLAKMILERWDHPVKRGIKPRADLIVLKQTKMPAVLVEMGFINNSEDQARLSNGEYCMMGCKAIVDSLEVFSGLI